MENSDVKAQCEREIEAIAYNRAFWERHITWLRQQGGWPSQDDVDWVEEHLKGLDANRQRLESYMAKIETTLRPPTASEIGVRRIRRPSGMEHDAVLAQPSSGAPGGWNERTISESQYRKEKRNPDFDELPWQGE